MMTDTVVRTFDVVKWIAPEIVRDCYHLVSAKREKRPQKIRPAEDVRIVEFRGRNKQTASAPCPAVFSFLYF